MSHSSGYSSFRRFWKPAVVTSAGGAAVTVWFEEILLFAGDFLAVIFLPIMAGVIFLLDLFIFKSRMPKREDLTLYQSHRRKEVNANETMAHPEQR